MEKNVSKQDYSESPGIFDTLRQKMHRLVDDFSVRGPSELGTGGTFLPRVDVEESENEIAVTAELPGIEKGDLSVSFIEGMLELRGEKREERRSGWRGRRSVERRYGFFRRLVPLPPEANTENATATFKNGVLTVTFPKRPEALTHRHRIEVTEGGTIFAEGDKIEFGKGGAGRVEEVKGSGIYPPDAPNPPKDSVQRAETSLGGSSGYPPQSEPPEKEGKMLEDDKQ